MGMFRFVIYHSYDLFICFFKLFWDIVAPDLDAILVHWFDYTFVYHLQVFGTEVFLQLDNCEAQFSEFSSYWLYVMFPVKFLVYVKPQELKGFLVSIVMDPFDTVSHKV